MFHEFPMQIHENPSQNPKKFKHAADCFSLRSNFLRSDFCFQIRTLPERTTGIELGSCNMIEW